MYVFFILFPSFLSRLSEASGLKLRVREVVAPWVLSRLSEASGLKSPARRSRTPWAWVSPLRGEWIEIPFCQSLTYENESRLSEASGLKFLIYHNKTHT